MNPPLVTYTAAPYKDVCVNNRTNPNGIVPCGSEFDNNASLELELIVLYAMIGGVQKLSVTEDSQKYPHPKGQCKQAKPGTERTYAMGQRVKLSDYDIKALNALYLSPPYLSTLRRNLNKVKSGDHNFLIRVLDFTNFILASDESGAALLEYPKVLIFRPYPIKH
ncbi:hypothetical protein RhiirA4_478072 [Rhizophagus irregularis]|uniref:Uncharacterized protein n=1 Tax=Rhizophagus irregularis TaxID=588596 RepID=A0A2I1HE75_9GLOM|nr:hypothetical protein RhiirA4_478072 [Rhizophagus irregularis]